MTDLSRRRFLRRAAVAVPAAAIAVPLAIKAVEAHVETVEDHGDTPFVASGEIEFNENLLVAEYEETRDIAVEHAEETCAFARKDHPEDLTLWCVKREDGKTYWVINGHWIYDPADPQWPPADLVWKGVAPFEHNEYNAAMNWIRGRIAA